MNKLAQENAKLEEENAKLQTNNEQFQNLIHVSFDFKFAHFRYELS